MSVAAGPLPQTWMWLACLWEASGTVSQEGHWGPGQVKHGMGTWPLLDGGQEGHWWVCWHEKGRVLPWTPCQPWCQWGICPSTKAGQLWVSRLPSLTLCPTFCGLLSLWSL